MKTVVKQIRSFLREDEGLTTVEYAVAGTLIALAVVVAFQDLGIAVDTNIDSITTNLGGTTH